MELICLMMALICLNIIMINKAYAKNNDPLYGESINDELSN